MANYEIFDLTIALPKRTGSFHTQRAYYRWVDQYLVDLAGVKPTRGDARIARMSRLSIPQFVSILTPSNLNTWLGWLVEEGHSRQGLDQARASIVTVAELMAQDDIITQQLYLKLRNVSTPPVDIKRQKSKILNRDELAALMNAARDSATSHNQLLRNSVATTMLCTMALRREELSAAKWGDLQRKGDRVFLAIRNGGGAVEVPRNLIGTLTRWREAIGDPEGASPLIRRIWKGGRIAKDGLSSDGIWLIVRDAAKFANLGHVTPDDLRRSAAGGLRDAGVPVEEISKLLRHKSIIITERYLKRIPKQKPNKRK